MDSAALWTTLRVDAQGLDNASRYPHCPQQLLLLKKNFLRTTIIKTRGYFHVIRQ